MEKDELTILGNSAVPAPQDEARARALAAALVAYDLENTAAATQEREAGTRLIDRATKLWRETMNRKIYATPAIAGLLALPIVGYTAYHLMLEQPSAFMPEGRVGETAKPVRAEKTVAAKPTTFHAEKKNDAVPGTLSSDITGVPLEKEAKPEAPATVASEQSAR